MTIERLRELLQGSSRRRRWLLKRVLSGAIFVGSLLVGAVAQAATIPIGAFNWSEYTPDECVVGLCGPFFFVSNFSTDPALSLGPLGASFFDVSVDLQTDSGSQSLSLGDIDPGNSSQSIDDLFGTTITTAALSLTFGMPLRPGSIQLLDEFGSVVAALTAPGSLQIAYSDLAPNAEVPEPSTWLHWLGGFSVLAYARRARATRVV